MNREPHVELRAHLGIFDGQDWLHPYLLSVGYGSATRQDPQDPLNREPHVDLRAHLGIFDGPDRGCIPISYRSVRGVPTRRNPRAS